MIKATSAERQAEVTVKEIDGEKQYTLFLNEKEVESPSFGLEGTEEKRTEFQYDFNQFYSNKADETDVKKNPSKYLDYVSDVEDTNTVPSEPTTPLEDRITTLEQRQDDADQALQDLICTIMGE